MSKITIGIYKSDGTLLGYKASPKWTLTSDKSDAERYVYNPSGDGYNYNIEKLYHIVTRTLGPLNFVFDEIFNILNSHKGLKVGYEFEDSDEPVITHMIESSGVYQISP